MPLARQPRHHQHISRLPHQPYPSFLGVKTIPPPSQKPIKKENRIVESYCLLLAHRNEGCENLPIVEKSKLIIEDHADRIGKITLASNIKPKETKPQKRNC